MEEPDVRFARGAPSPWKEPGHSVVNVNNDEYEQVDTPADRNRNGGSLGRVHVRDDRTETLSDRRKRRRSP